MTGYDAARPWPCTKWDIEGVTWTVGALRRGGGETTKQGTIISHVPNAARAARPFRIVHDEPIPCEAIHFAGGAGAIDTALRRGGISGRVEVGGRIEDHFADLLDGSGNIVETVALDRASYAALKDRCIKCRVERS